MIKLSDLELLSSWKNKTKKIFLLGGRIILAAAVGMKKVCTWWVLKLLAPIHHVNRVDCCQELLEQSEVNPAKFFDCIVTGDEFWIHHCDPLSQLEAEVWKRLGEQTPTRLRQERSAGKIMMMIFWDKDGVLLTEYLPLGTTINGASNASIIERLRSVIVEKGRGKVSSGVLILHHNTPIHMSTLLFVTLASSNRIIRPIPQILHRLITICSQTRINLFV